MRKLLFKLTAVSLGCAISSFSTMSCHDQIATGMKPVESARLSQPGEQDLRSIVASAKLSYLQWPNFSNHSQSVNGFYEETEYKLGWVQGGKPTPQALELISILENAEKKGLESRDYDGERWTDRLKLLETGGPEAESRQIKFDVALTVSGIRYISDLHLGKVDPESLHKDFDPERLHHDAGVFLREKVVAAESVKDALTTAECPYSGYQRDIVALQKYLQLETLEVPDPLPQVQKSIEPGNTYHGLPKLIKRLQFLEDLSTSDVARPDSYSYTDEVVAAVKHFQTRHGLEADGKLGSRTIVELNRPIRDRVQQLRLSLERWRWLPHDFTEPPIVVNIPEYKLRAYESLSSGKPELAMSVVVGKSMRTQTPVLDEDMKYMVFWPYWNVPPSILRGEIVPKIAKDRSYIQKHNYEVVTYSGEVVTDGNVSDEVLAQLSARKLTVRQKPGPQNALGLAKFIFPNDNNVYLHSTPAQSLFSKTRRDFSHGCIRVEDPKELAVWVLRNNTGWTRERVESAFRAEKEQQVNLARRIPVLIVYASAIAEEDGQVYFLEDIYGHDQSLAKLEARAYSSQN